MHFADAAEIFQSSIKLPVKTDSKGIGLFTARAELHFQYLHGASRLRPTAASAKTFRS
jgi:hypothetical protein